MIRTYLTVKRDLRSKNVNITLFALQIFIFANNDRKKPQNVTEIKSNQLSGTIVSKIKNKANVIFSKEIETKRARSNYGKSANLTEGRRKCTLF